MKGQIDPIDSPKDAFARSEFRYQIADLQERVSEPHSYKLLDVRA